MTNAQTRSHIIHRAVDAPGRSVHCAGFAAIRPCHHRQQCLGTAAPPAATVRRANGAVYMTIANGGAAADAVVSATSDAAKTVELHEVRNEGGVMAMRPLESFPLPAGGTLEMKPGSYHVMLLGLTRHLHAGDTVKVTLPSKRRRP